MESRRAKIDRLKLKLLDPEPTVCPYLGAATGDSITCPSCRGHVEVKTFRCAKFGACTLAKPFPGVKCCATCPDNPVFSRARSAITPVRFSPIRTRNLLYYVYPVSGTGVWQDCIDSLSQKINLFNGKVVLCVSQDPKSGRSRPYGVIDGPRVGRTTDSTAEVENRLLAQASGLKSRLTVLEVANDPALWESKHHKLMFSQVVSAVPTEATLYAHAKGTTRPDWHPAHRWRRVLEETLIDRWDRVEDALRTHPVAGSFKKVGRGWPAHESKSPWHYSGTFAWIRNRELFSRDWLRIDKFWAGMESYFSLHFKKSEAGCVFHEGRVPTMNLYSETYWRDVVEPELSRWRSARPVAPV